ncbi:MAG: 3-(methylthio)propionyl-CoA ligase [Betaproteobacteria bacterium]
MLGLMMDQPLLISSLLTHAARNHSDTEIVSRTVEGGIHRTTYSELELRSRKLAQALGRLGVQVSDRVGSLAWNGYRHLELYYAASGSGAVMHTVNPRLFPEQIGYIINHADDKLLFIDLTFVPLIEKLAPACKSVRHVVVMTDRDHMPPSLANSVPNALCYEELIAAETGEYDWPTFDEKTASSLCYTSGTTGNPKGVLYHHRSTVIHSYAIVSPDVFNLSSRDCLLPVVPMFHVNAWGLPYAAPLVGCKVVFPGAQLDGASLFELYESEQVTATAGVPTVWLALLNHMKQNKLKFSSLNRAVVGGSAVPPAMIKAFGDDFGVLCQHAWGMSEMSPLGTFCTLKGKHLALPPDQQFEILTSQGRALFGVDMKIVGGDGVELPRDGTAFGDLLVRGPWITNGYFKGEGGDPLRDGWFPTGDVGTIDPDGYLRITDRSKDVIKSGGEWISSIDLENAVMGHPAVAEAAVIGVAHPKWDERPLLIVVKKPGQEVSREELLKFYDGKVAKWWIPDDVVFVETLPHTATGKLLKIKLREEFKGHRLPSA